MSGLQVGTDNFKYSFSFLILNPRSSRIFKILENLGFKIKKEKKYLKLTVPTWRPDISQEIDIVEELVRITGYDKIKIIDPIKERTQSTLTQ